jgi:hypothetical protein
MKDNIYNLSFSIIVFWWSRASSASTSILQKIEYVSVVTTNNVDLLQ